MSRATVADPADASNRNSSAANSPVRRISEGSRAALLLSEFARVGQAGPSPFHGADAEKHVAQRPVPEIAELRNGLERAVGFKLHCVTAAGSGGRVHEAN